MIVVSREVGRDVSSLPGHLSVPSPKYFITIQGLGQTYTHGLAYM